MADYDGITKGPGNQGPVPSGNPHTIEQPTQANPWQGDNFNITNRNQQDLQRGASKGVLDIGDLGRNYNFGNTYTNLSFQRDPFIHLLTKFKKKPTDDFKFEYAVKRNNATFKRYGYVIGISANGADYADAHHAAATTWNAAALQAICALDTNRYQVRELPDAQTTTNTDDVVNLMMAGDYKTHGNITSVMNANASGVGSGGFTVGELYTFPNYFLVNQVIRIPVTDSLGGDVKDYALARILDASKTWKSSTSGGTVLAEGPILKVKMIKYTGSTNKIPTSLVGAAGAEDLVDVNAGWGNANSVAGKLEPLRTYISGTAYHELSGYGDTWKQQPFTTDFGQTQIFKKTAMMSGRAMATKLKFGENPWANEWRDKMAEMTWEIGQAGYFGEQYTDDDGITYTEGIVNFILNNGNQLKWSDSLTVDDYLEQLSALHDPRYMVGNKQSQVYFCDTEVWNWHAKLGGFMKNNAEISPNYNIQFSGTGKMAGVKYRSFDVDGTSIKLVRDIHLDQTNVKMICANMSACAIRPLVGNGVNRDVTVYPGVKTVKNSGEDYRVDLIQGDIGFEFGAPETHAVWTV
tara:strand:- start:689 stop:2419 length:1731 start_codon:yes stop_codon:yes gene_type:complete